MQKHNESDAQERLLHAIEDLGCSVDGLKNTSIKDYTSLYYDIMVAIKEIGEGFKNEGCLKKIHHELHLLNKTLIMSALLISATKDPEKTLKEYYNIINQYLY